MSKATQDEAGERAHAARIWARRSVAERQAAARFARLRERLQDTNAAAQVVAMAAAAASDERRHAELCDALAVHLGGRASSGRPAPAPEVAPSGLLPRARVLYEVVAMSCITETLSAALLGTMMEAAVDERVRDTVHEVLRDEVAHSQLGWAHLSIEAAQGASFLSDYLPAMLEGTVTEELFADDDEPDVSASRLGALSRIERRDVFTRTMTEVVFPGFERFSVDASAGRRWLALRLGE